MTEFQAIDDFHSFYHMEAVATATEISGMLQKHADASYLFFPEARFSSGSSIRVKTGRGWLLVLAE